MVFITSSWGIWFQLSGHVKRSIPHPGVPVGGPHPPFFLLMNIWGGRRGWGLMRWARGLELIVGSEVCLHSHTHAETPRKPIKHGKHARYRETHGQPPHAQMTKTWKPRCQRAYGGGRVGGLHYLGFVLLTGNTVRPSKKVMYRQFYFSMTVSNSFTCHS